jgi:hypothetical protein
MENKTAVEWLEEQTRTPEWKSLKRGDIFEQAKEMEKQQIIDAYEEATYHNTFGNKNYESPEEYYNEIFKKNSE